MKQEEEIRRRTCRVEQFSFGAGFWSTQRRHIPLDPTALSDETSLSAAEFCWPVSPRDTIHRDKETCLWWCYHCCQKSVAWLLGGLKLEQAAVSAWSVGLTPSGFCSIWDGYIKDITISKKRICSNLVIASYIWKLARWPVLIARVASYLFIF